MHGVQSVGQGAALVRDQLVTELEQELVSEARRTRPELIAADTFADGSANMDFEAPVNTFVATAPVNTFLSIAPDLS